MIYIFYNIYIIVIKNINRKVKRFNIWEKKILAR